MQVPVSATIQSSGSSIQHKELMYNLNQNTSAYVNNQVVRVIPNPNHHSKIPIPTSAFLPSTNNSSSIPKAQRNNTTSHYRPTTLNTITTDTSTKNEPVYATVGSVNSNQKLLKNLKSANVWQKYQNVEIKTNEKDIVEFNNLPSFEEVMI